MLRFVLATSSLILGLAVTACSSDSAPSTPADDAGADAQADGGADSLPSNDPVVLATATGEVRWIEAYGDALYWITSTGEVDVLDAKGTRTLGTVSLGRCAVAFAKGVLVSSKTATAEELITFTPDGTKKVQTGFHTDACTIQGQTAVVVGARQDGPSAFTDGVAFVGGATLDFRAGAVSNSTSAAGATANDLYLVVQNSKAQEDLYIASFSGSMTLSLVASNVPAPSFSPVLPDGSDLLWITDAPSARGVVRFDAAKKEATMATDLKGVLATGESLSGSFAFDASSFYLTVTTSGSSAAARLLRVNRTSAASTELATGLVYSAPVTLFRTFAVSLRETATETEIVGFPR